MDYLTGLLLEWQRYENLGFGGIHFLPLEPRNRESSPAERKLSSNGGRDRETDRQRGESRRVYILHSMWALCSCSWLYFLPIMPSWTSVLDFHLKTTNKNSTSWKYISLLLCLFKLVSTDLFSTKTPLHTKSWDRSVKVWEWNSLS